MGKYRELLILYKLSHVRSHTPPLEAIPTPKMHGHMHQLLNTIYSVPHALQALPDVYTNTHVWTYTLVHLVLTHGWCTHHSKTHMHYHLHYHHLILIHGQNYHHYIYIYMYISNPYIIHTYM